MKNKVTALILSLLLASSAYAQSSIEFTSYLVDGTSVRLSNDNFATTLTDGYVVSFWYSSVSIADLKPIGISVLGDVLYNEYIPDSLGGFEWRTLYSQPLTVPEGSTGYLGIRIFQLPEKIGSSVEEWLSYCDTLSQQVAADPNSTVISNLWFDALETWNLGTGGEIADWPTAYNAGMNASINGTTMEDVFHWVAGGKYYLQAPPNVPEPAEIAAIFGLITLGLVASRRRKK